MWFPFEVPDNRHPTKIFSDSSVIKTLEEVITKTNLINASQETKTNMSIKLSHGMKETFLDIVNVWAEESTVMSKADAEKVLQ